MAPHRVHRSRKSSNIDAGADRRQRRPNLPTLRNSTLPQYPFIRNGTSPPSLSGRGKRISPTSAHSLGPLPRIQRSAARRKSGASILPTALGGPAQLGQQTREGSHPPAANPKIGRRAERESSAQSDREVMNWLDNWTSTRSTPGELQRRRWRRHPPDAPGQHATDSPAAKRHVDAMHISEKAEHPRTDQTQKPAEHGQPNSDQQAHEQQVAQQLILQDKIVNRQEQNHPTSTSGREQKNATDTTAPEDLDITQLIHNHSTAYQALSTIVHLVENSFQNGDASSADAMINHSASTPVQGLQMTILFDSGRRPLITAESQSAIWVILRSKQRSFKLNPVGSIPVQLVRATRNVRSAWVQARNDVAKTIKGPLNLKQRRKIAERLMMEAMNVQEP